jgi:hypothetical protein
MLSKSVTGLFSLKAKVGLLLSLLFFNRCRIEKRSYVPMPLAGYRKPVRFSAAVNFFGIPRLLALSLTLLKPCPYTCLPLFGGHPA